MSINRKDIRREKSTLGGYVGDGDADRTPVPKRSHAHREFKGLTPKKLLKKLKLPR